MRNSTQWKSLPLPKDALSHYQHNIKQHSDPLMVGMSQS